MRILFLFYCVFFSGFVTAQEIRFRFTQQKMGSPFHLILFTTDSIKATTIANESFRLVDSLNNIFSDYIPASELNLLCTSAGTNTYVPLSPALYEIFLKAEEAWKNTNGKFDITVGPLTRLWRKARSEKYFPHPESIKKEKEKVGWNKLIIDKNTHRIKLLQPGMQLDLGGIAAGYMAQKVLDFLKTQGITSALVDASGDIVCSTAPPGKMGWTIGINQPNETQKLLEKYIELENRSVSTSGDVYQYIEYEGKKYSHIVDPQTGYGVNFQRNVTIISKDGTKADWLATAGSILPLHTVKRLAKKMKVEFLVTQQKNKKIKQYASAGFRNYWQKTN